MPKTALLVVDMQNALILEHPFDEKRLVKTVAQMEDICRNKGIEVIFVRHEDNTLVPGESGFEIYSKVAPRDGEKIFNKRFNSAFRGTGLLDYLHEQGIERIIVCGMQTDFCVDATVKAGFEHGFEIIVPRGGHTTFDNRYLSGEELYHYYSYEIWNHRYAQVMSVDHIEECL
ncbi:MAG: cysteine hydrolase [Clostridiales bacterium]|nr:cysteine hydrolase [Candidatus Scatonaster coprocaballi]